MIDVHTHALPADRLHPWRRTAAFLRSNLRVVALVAALAIPATVSAQLAARPEPLTPTQQQEIRATFAQWRGLERGPYLRIRWFCADGTLLAPGPRACADHGGGRQHAEHSAAALALRDLGFHAGPILAGLTVEEFADDRNDHYFPRELVVQEFLQRIDDGWVMRRARYYRGARQAEDEEAIGATFLSALARRPGWLRQHHLLANLLVAAVPHGVPGVPGPRIRSLSERIANAVPEFMPLRVKIHSSPDASDLPAVQAFLARRSATRDESTQLLAELVAELENQYMNRMRGERWNALVGAARAGELEAGLRDLPARMATATLPDRLRILSNAMAGARDALENGAVGRPIAMIDLLGEMESVLFVQSSAYAAATEGATMPASREQILQVARSLLGALYASGWLAADERTALVSQSRLLDAAPAALEPARYAQLVRSLTRAVEWSAATVEQTFAAVLTRYGPVEPLVKGFRDDALRGSLVLPLSRLLDRLANDAALAVGVTHQILGQSTATGIVGLNPGSAIGPLRLAVGGEDLATLDPNAIYVLPETPSDLSRVAGILTLDGGSRLSHVQLLARGLGIPNAAVTSSLATQLADLEGEEVFYAVGPAGNVLLDRVANLDPSLLQQVRRQNADDRPQLTIDTDRLNLSERRVLPLQALGRDDSGRVAGPKAANLGQLKRFFGERVAAGLVIPFGIFRAHVDRDLDGDGRTLYEEIVEVVHSDDRDANGLPAGLSAVRDKIRSMPLLDGFRNELIAAIDAELGGGAGGIFVRSDTNVEDLPNFSGAGLNLTVMNVVERESLFSAIRRVWASPFTDRSFQWRLRVVTNPESIYPSIVLLSSVASEASGVLVTTDTDNWSGVPAASSKWTVTLSEGIGGSVDGEPTEAWLLAAEQDDAPVLLSSARAPWRKELIANGGMREVPATGYRQLLDPARLADLREVVAAAVERYSSPGGADVWDIEFGFVGARTVLFQIRPFVQRATTVVDALLPGASMAPGRSSDLVDLAAGPRP